MINKIKKAIGKIWNKSLFLKNEAIMIGWWLWITDSQQY